MNNNRLKFRVWDLKNQSMHEVFAIDWSNGAPIACHTESKKLYQRFDEPSFILMQCIGMPDQNGNLIYESDIVETTKGLDQTVIQNVVTFHDMGFTPFIPILNGHSNPIGFYCHPNSVKKIGDIYTTPHLLKK